MTITYFSFYEGPQFKLSRLSKPAQVLIVAHLTSKNERRELGPVSDDWRCSAVGLFCAFRLRPTRRPPWGKLSPKCGDPGHKNGARHRILQLQPLVNWVRSAARSERLFRGCAYLENTQSLVVLELKTATGGMLHIALPCSRTIWKKGLICWSHASYTRTTQSLSQPWRNQLSKSDPKYMLQHFALQNNWFGAGFGLVDSSYGFKVGLGSFAPHCTLASLASLLVTIKRQNLAVVQNTNSARRRHDSVRLIS